MESFAEHLDIAIRAARAAGDLLRADFHRPLGPRGEGDKAPVDTEAEQRIRDILLGEGGEWGFLGEETGLISGRSGAPTWVVDPNDGTRDYIKGRRGSSVSIALVWQRRPVLGVVHAFGYPDDRGPVYSAAIGRDGVFRDGAPVEASLPDRLSELDLVLVSGGADRAARANLQCARPARVMSIPSIAHRLARVASGEASATTSLYSPKTWDFAAGHCLILAAGGVILDQHGREPVYGDDGSGSSPRLFAGSRAVALELSTRDWDLAFRSEREASVPIVRLGRGQAVSDSSLLSRAQGALLGHFVGSALGVLFAGVEAKSADLAAIAAAARPRRRSPGQLGPSGEMAVACARSLLDLASDARGLKRAYLAWLDSSPENPDRAVESALRSRPLGNDLSAAALARVTPLTLWSHAADPAIAAAKATEDAALTHPSRVAGEAAAILGVVLHSLFRGADPAAAIAEAHAFARRSGHSPEAIAAVVESSTSLKGARAAEDADALRVVRAGLFHLLRTPSFEDAIESALALGPTADALPAVIGALMGARLGREGIPMRLRNLVLSCRPMEGLAARPRPPVYWATDAMAMAEALLTAR
jgi:fructose-1,6-bisphosphatase/inositol monophosphatase family enzyme/ADP-ribosylglycohydrolase